MKGYLIMTTEKQRKANQENALQSTGPATEPGKVIVSRNAIKHGIFARELVITTGDGREDYHEYQQLLLDLETDLQPEGKMEQLLVEKIAVNYWRLRRLIRYETGEIRQKLDAFMQSALEKEFEHSRNPYSSQPTELTYYQIGEEILPEQKLQIEARLEALHDTNFNVAADEDCIAYVMNHRLESLDGDKLIDKRKKAVKHLKELSPQQQGKLRSILRDEVIQKLNEIELVQRWNTRFQILSRLKSIPSQLNLDKIVKYEGALERSIFKTLQSLSELQKRRISLRKGK